jgi:hypothetical protein
LVGLVLNGSPALSSPAAQEQGVVARVTPRIVETSPLGGEELPTAGTLSYTFNTPMDQASVEAAFAVFLAGTTQPVAGVFTWADNGRSFTFKPNGVLRRNAEYRVNFGSRAKSADGVALLTGETYRVRTVSALEVTTLIPAAGSKDIGANAVITAIFNRPVVPLVPLAELDKLPNPFTFNPPITGKGTWVNTSTYQFTPERPLAGGGTYRATIKAGLTDVSGVSLAADVSTNFTVASPSVIEIYPVYKSQNIARDQVINIAFSQAMNRDAAESGITLTGANGVAVQGKFTWSDGDKFVSFKPAQPLDYNGLYDIAIDNSKARSDTGAPLKSSALSSFTVVGLPQISDVIPNNGVTTDYTYFSVQFSTAMKASTLEKLADKLVLSPKPARLDFSFDGDDSYQVSWLLGTDDGITYTATLDLSGVTDTYGTPLVIATNRKEYIALPGNKIQSTFTIKLDYPPQASLQTGGLIGLYSAYSPSTRVYSTHRNVSRLNLELYRLTLEQTVPFLTNFGYDEVTQLQPPPSQFLRNWQVTVENPPMVYRYDLLDISATGPSAPPDAAFVCEGSLPARLKKGMTGEVLPQPPTPSNLRAQPSRSANVVARIPPGTTFAVLEGPRCSGGIVWYQTRYNNVTGWLAEGIGREYFIGPFGNNANATLTAPRPTAQPGTGKEALKPGYYLLNFSSPDLLQGNQDPIKHIMVVGTANLTMKMSGTRATVWVTDLKTGLPVADASVQFFSRTVKYDNQGEIQRSPLRDMGANKTDANGITFIEYPLVDDLYSAQLFAVIDDGKQFGIGSNTLSSGIEPFNYGLDADYSPTDATVYLYSDRSVYKPGQPVYFRGVVRTKNDVIYSLYRQSDLKKIDVEVLNDEGQSIFQGKADLTEYGTFSAGFTLGKNAGLGTYQIVAKLPDPVKSKAEGKEVTRNFTRVINVAEYRTPEFQVNLTTPTTELVQGDTIQVEVNSTYFFGGGVSNAPITWTITSSPSGFQYTGRGSYTFSDYDEDAGPSGEDNIFGVSIANGQGKTDNAGKFLITLPADLGRRKATQEFTVEASVTDESKQVVSGRVLLTIHPGGLYIGATPEEFIGTAGKVSKINLLTVGLDSAALPNTPLSIRAVEREWKSVREVDPNSGRTVWKYAVKETPITESTLATDADGKGVFSFTPPRGGVYKVYATTRDPKGNQVTTATYLYVAGSDFVAWRQRNDYSFDVKTDRKDYKVGDEATLLIASPFQGAAKAWITVERGGILKSEVIDLTTNSTLYKLPITADLAPNAYVSVLVVKGTDEKNPVAAFRLGMTPLSVNAERYKLNIEITADKQSAAPREDVTYTLKVTDYQGKPVKSEVGVGLTDLAVLSVLPDTSTPILNHFYNRQGLSVRTSSTLTISVDEQTQSILNTIKGGGGGGPEGGIFEIRQLFVDTPLWSPTIVTDENGIAKVTVTLPDQLTTWRMDARAVSLPTGELNTTLVGQQTGDLISTKPLLVRPLTPRFFIAGDQSTLGATVNNNTGADQEVTLEIILSGAKLTGANQVKFTVKKGERNRADFPIIVDSEAEGLDVTFSVVTADGKFKDAAKSSVIQGDTKLIPVYRYEAPETVATSGTIGKTGGTQIEGIVLPTALNTSMGKLDVRVNTSLTGFMADSVQALNANAYDCTEGLSSRLLANSTALAILKDAESETYRKIREQVNISLQSLYSQQHIDGGWGWCFRDRSSGHVSAYVLLAMLQAKESGVVVDENVIRTGIGYLNLALRELNEQSQPYLLNRQALMLHALAKAGSGNLSRTLALYNVRERMGIYARALLLETIHILTPTDTARQNTLISDFQNTGIISASGLHWEERTVDYFNWNTNTRTTSIVLAALIRVQPTNPQLPNIVRWLAYARSMDGWESTQETAWVLRALNLWLPLSGDLVPNYQFSSKINGKDLIPLTRSPTNPTQIDTVFNASLPVADLNKGDVNNLLFSRNGGDGTLYYVANLSVYVPVPEVAAVNRGINVTRKYSLVSDRTGTPITGAKVGDNVRVTITLSVSQDMYNVVLTDPIPAGTEALNPDLATTGGVGVAPEIRLNNPFEDGYGWWWFGDTQFRDQATLLSAEYLPKGTYTYTYVVRAGLEGVYNVIPTTAQQTYFPEVYGRSNGVKFTIAP